MPVIKSVDELKRIRGEIQQKKGMKANAGSASVTVVMGTCSIATGARETLQSILNCIEREKISGITVTQTGCRGRCEDEPIIEVVLGNQPKVMYGKVDARVAQRIMKQHVQDGQPVREHIIA